MPPIGYRPIRRQQLEVAHAVAPHEGCRNNVIGIARRGSAEIGLMPQHEADRQQRFAEGGQSDFAAGLHGFERVAEAGLSAGAEIILIPGVNDGEQVAHDEAGDPADQHRIGPGVDEASMGAAGHGAEQRRHRVCILQIRGDGPGVREDFRVVADHRHPVLAGEGDLLLVGEAPGDGFDREAFMREGESGAPAIGTEAKVRVGAGEVVEDDAHAAESAAKPGVGPGFEGGQSHREEAACVPVTSARPVR